MDQAAVRHDAVGKTGLTTVGGELFRDVVDHRFNCHGATQAFLCRCGAPASAAPVPGVWVPDMHGADVGLDVEANQRQSGHRILQLTSDSAAVLDDLHIDSTRHDHSDATP